MKSRYIGVATPFRRSAMLVCLAMAVILQVGCLSTWDFRSNDLKIKIVTVDLCSDVFPLGYDASAGDTVTFINHAGKDVTLEFPENTVTAQDEDPTSNQTVEVTVKDGRKKRITIAGVPDLTQDANNNGVIRFRIKDPCHGGADMIIQPAN